jgi:flagellar hook assembly protein FlgD
LQIINMNGQVVRTMAMPASGSITWNGTNDQGQSMVAGIYLARLYKGNVNLTQKKLVLAK